MIGVWVVSQQSFGLTCCQKVIIGCDEGKRRELIVQERPVEMQSAGQMDSVVASQFMASGQFDGFIHALRINREQMTPFLHISRQPGSSFLILSLCDELAPQFAGKSSRNLYSTDVHSSNNSRRVVTACLNPD